MHQPGRGARPQLGLHPDCLEQHVHADDPGAQEVVRGGDGAIDVSLGGEVDDRVRLGEEGRDHGRVADVALNEAQPRPECGVVLEVSQVFAQPGVGQLVEDDDGVAAPRQAARDEGRADEAGAAGHQQPHQSGSAERRAAWRSDS